MKSFKIFYLLILGTLVWSCSDDDDEAIELVQPTFNVIVPTDDSGLYIFENTTPNKEEFYNYWEFTIGGNKIADINGPIEYQYEVDGIQLVTLTMVSQSNALQTSETVTVTLPPPPDESFVINPESLLQNGYLTEGEGNDFTNWGKYNGADRMTEQSSEILVGNRALKVTNDVDGNPWETQFVSDAFPTTNGENYTASMWIKGDAATVRFSTNPGVGGDQYAGDYTATGSWTQYSWTFTANSDTTLLALDMGASAGEFYVDAIEVVPGDVALPLPSNDSELMNGDFEEGEGTSFTNWNVYNGDGRFSEEVVDVLSGGRALKVSNPVDGNPWESQFVSDGFDTVNGQDYTVSMWIKGDPVTVRYSTNPGVGGDQYAGDYVATSDWTKYSWTFTANSDTTLIALDMGTTQGDFIVDAVKVVAN